MKHCSWWLLVLLGGYCAAGEPVPVCLADPVKIPDFDLAAIGDRRVVELPPLPRKAGFIPVVRMKMYADAPKAAGCFRCVELSCNETPLGRFAGTEERLQGRCVTFQLPNYPGREFPVFSGARIMLTYGPDWRRANAVSTDRHAAEFCFRIDDAARGVDGNTLTLVNTRVTPGAVCIRDMEVGYYDAELLPKAPSRVPERGCITRSLERGGLVLKQGTAGGFALLEKSGGRELRVDTALGMSFQSPAFLLAEDGKRAAEVVRHPTGFTVTAKQGDLILNRELVLRDGLLRWKDCWRNTGKTVCGVPFQYRFYLSGSSMKCYLGGDPDAGHLASQVQNPTLFLESPDRCGFGIAAECDWLRLLMGLHESGGVADLYSQTLALEPGREIVLELSIEPETAKEGYFGYLNRLRERWGLNGATMPAPFFWESRPERLPGRDLAAKFKASYGHLGPAIVGFGQWMSTRDIQEITSGKYPKLAPDTPRAPGDCPDFDAKEFVTFRHLEKHYEQMKRDIALLHESCPEVRALPMIHPAMIGVYKPQAELWPFADSVTLTAQGKPFESGTYSLGWFRDWTNRGFGIYYYTPRPGSRYYDFRMRMTTRLLDDCGADGLYSDEFSWSFSKRDYSRYDYSRKDGYSADLDTQGRVVRFKSDNAYTSVPFQLATIKAVHERGKFFFFNGGAGSNAVMRSPVMRFAEGGNGIGAMAEAHLNPVPMVLGNFGDFATLPGVMAGVRTALARGTLYSPHRCNRLLVGRDNFVSKLYPFTTVRIASGTMVGRERLVAMHSGTYRWPGAPDGEVNLYLYHADGNRDKACVTGRVEKGAITLAVPPGGLAIAEQK